MADRGSSCIKIEQVVESNLGLKVETYLKVLQTVRLGNCKTSDSKRKVLFSKNFKTQRISFSMFKIKIYIKKLKRLRAHTARKLKFSIKDFFSKFDLIHVFQQIWSYLLNKWWMETFIFCAMSKNVVGESTQGTVYPISILCLLCLQIYFRSTLNSLFQLLS